MSEINPLPLPHICHAPIGCIAQCILCQIILWIKPFFLEFSPKSLCDIQMWRVWWQEKEEQSSFLSTFWQVLSHFHNPEVITSSLMSDHHKKTGHTLTGGLFVRGRISARGGWAGAWNRRQFLNLWLPFLRLCLALQNHSHIQIRRP